MKPANLGQALGETENRRRGESVLTFAFLWLKSERCKNSLESGQMENAAGWGEADPGGYRLCLIQFGIPGTVPSAWPRPGGCFLGTCTGG